MDVINFWSFAAQPKKGCCLPGVVVSVVDGCLHAMEEGRLSVIAQQNGCWLWELYILTTDQWARLCALVQRHRLPPTLLWRLQSRVRWTRHPGCVETYLVSDDLDAVAALSRIEFLWQDLGAVQAWLQLPGDYGVEWVAAEVDRRRQWFTGLRRAWLLALVTGSGY